MSDDVTPELLERFWSKVDRGDPEDCWPWIAGLADGYGWFGFGPPRGNQRAHRLVWEFTNGAIPDGLYVCHECDNRSCCNPEHLWLGTHLDNIRDMCAKGRAYRGPRPRGEAHPGAKLTAPRVVEIRRRVAAGERQWDLSREFGITQSLISLIVNRKIWRSVP